MVNEYSAYQLKPAPPKWELQAYIDAYFQEKDDKYLACFFHYYEPVINKKAFDAGNRFAMQTHFADLKQGYVEGLLRALKHYDPTKRVPFLVYAEKYAADGMKKYANSAAAGYSPDNENQWDKLRRVMWEWGQLERDSSTKAMEQIAVKTGYKLKDVTALIQLGTLNENVVGLYRRYGDEDSEKTVEEILPDASSDPAKMYERCELYSRLWATFDALELEEQTMLAEILGFCLQCHSTHYIDPEDKDGDGIPRQKPIPRMMYSDIATAHGYSDGHTVTEKCKKALNKIKCQLERKYIERKIHL